MWAKVLIWGAHEGARGEEIGVGNTDNSIEKFNDIRRSEVGHSCMGNRVEKEEVAVECEWE